MTHTNSLSTEDTRKKNNAFRIVATILGGSVVGLIFNTIIAIQINTWQVYGILVPVTILGILAFTSLGLIRSGQIEKGMRRIIVGMLIILPPFVLLISGLGFILGIIIVATTYFYASQTLPVKDVRQILLASLGVGTLTAATDFLALEYRMQVPAIQTFAPIATVVAMAFVGFFVVRQAWDGHSIRNKLSMPIIALVLLAFLALVSFNAVSSIQAIDENEDKRQQLSYGVFLGRLDALEDLALALATEVANNPEVQAAFASGDRERLIELTLDSYLLIDEQFDVPQFQFHVPPATSFLRLHSLEQFGDDLSSFRSTVVEANAEKRPISGLEIGRGGLGVRGVVPVNYEGKHIGTVEFGINVDQALIEAMKDQYGSEWQILLSKEPADIATFVETDEDTSGPLPELLFQASTLDEPYFANADSYQKALQGEAVIFHREAGDLEVAILTAPIYDYSGNIIGVIDIISDHTAVIEQQNSQVTLSLFIALIALVIVGGGIYFVTMRTLRPLEELTQVAGAIANGDLSQKAHVESQDELGIFAQTFNTMTSQLQETLGGLEQRVAERTKDLATVARISTATATIRDPFEMLAKMVHLTQRGFNLYHAHVFTYHQETDELKIVACGYKEGDEHEGTHGTTSIPLSREQSLVARAARTRKPIIVNDVRSDPGWLPNPLLPDTHAELAVPMIVGDELLGVLDVQAEHVDAFTEEDADIQMTLATQVATALQNARSYDQSRRQAEFETLVNVIGQKIQRAGTVEETLQTAVRELGTAIGASKVKAKIQPASSAVPTENTSVN